MRTTGTMRAAVTMLLLGGAVLSSGAASGQETRQAERVDADAAEALVRKFHFLDVENTPRGLQFTITGMQFDRDPFIDGQADPAIAAIADFLEERKDRPVLVEAFTDAIGTPAYSVDMTQRQAATVRDMLVRGGVRGDRIEFCGYGDAFQLAIGDSPAQRERNRRFHIVLGLKDVDYIPSMWQVADADTPVDIPKSDLETKCETAVP